MFIVVEGPNGVGKTTLCSALAHFLTDKGVDTAVVSEPSATQFGRLIRSGEANLVGRSLALAVAADRWQQQHTVRSLIASGKVVISDRYVPSSLVLQRLDGLSLEEIWAYNRYLPAADHVFYLDEAVEIIQQRVDARGKKQSRLELEGSAAREVALYRDAYAFLSSVGGWSQSYIHSNTRPPSEVCEEVVRHLSL